MSNRWALYIDIEGFSNIYIKNGYRALNALSTLQDDIYRIAKEMYPKPGERLFIHQLGDGFVIVSDFEENDLTRPLSIATVLMRSVLFKNMTARSAISEGEFADISSIFSKNIKNDSRGSNILRPGSGIMTIFRVMGDALVNAVNIAKNKPKGSCLLVDNKLKHKIPSEHFAVLYKNKYSHSIDWMRVESKLISDLCNCINIEFGNERNLHTLLKSYIEENKLNRDWIQNSRRLLKKNRFWEIRIFLQTLINWKP